MSRNVKLGVNAWVWSSPFNRNSVGLIEKSIQMGFDSFTIPIEEPSLIDCDVIRYLKSLQKIELNATGAYGPDRDLTHHDASIRNNSLKYIHESLKICEALGIKLLVGPAYSAVGKRRKVSPSQKQSEWELAVQGLRKAGEMASNYGVTLAIEPLNRFETDLVNTASQVKRLIRDIGHSSVKIHLDTFHMNIEEESMFEAFVIAGEDLVYVDTSESNRGTPGQGCINWLEVKQALDTINYKGSCVIESFTPDCTTIADAAAIWRPLASSQDSLARDGLIYLKKVFGQNSQYNQSARPTPTFVFDIATRVLKRLTLGI